MSFRYPRLIDVHRPASQQGVGRIGYGGQVVCAENLIARGLRASIQERREGKDNKVALPSDGMLPTWYIFIPRSIAALGLIRSRDIIVDDLCSRYQVIAPYWNSLGYRLSALSLEA